MSRKKPRLESPATTSLTAWQQFYQSVRDPAWPDCAQEQDFDLLPAWIQQECRSHGYVPGQYQDQPRLAHRIFPIKSDTACQLKWTWSTVFLTLGTTASCHRTNQHQFDTDSFDFHNTPQKLQDRQRMLAGSWPEQGCGYCRDIEQAGGQSDRMTNLDMPGIHAPPELDHDIRAVTVTPRILEVYFSNTCNLKCVYCGPHFSSLWDAENKRHGRFERNGLTISAGWRNNPNMQTNKQKLFAWMADHANTLTNFNVLGGEPLFQRDLDDCIEFFTQHPCPDLDLQIFTNLNATPDRVNAVIGRVRDLVDRNHIAKFTVTASLDCWGKPQEYARFPLKLDVWQTNFELLLAQPWIRLVVGSTITPLTIHTLPDLIQRLNDYRTVRPVHHYFNSVNSPSYMFIDILGPIFREDFQRALDIMPRNNGDEINVWQYLAGIKQQSESRGVNDIEVIKLATFLDEMDRRRNLDWRRVFPWLVDPIKAVVDQKRA